MLRFPGFETLQVVFFFLTLVFGVAWSLNVWHLCMQSTPHRAGQLGHQIIKYWPSL